MISRLAVLVFALSLAPSVSAAADPGGCQRVESDPRPLDLQRSADRRHLYRDAVAAEEIAIRLADAERGHRSGDYRGSGEYAAARDQCIARLFAAIGRDHRVSEDAVRQSLADRPLEVDLLLMALFAVVYLAVVYRAAAWLRPHLAMNSAIWSACAIAGLSIAMSAIGVGVGEIWSSAWEMIRVGNGHLSYRVARIPWTQHRLALFVGGIALGAIVSARRVRCEA